MAAKSITLTDNGISASQQLDSISSSILIRGDSKGGEVTLLASSTDSDFSPVVGARLKPNGVWQLRLPSGWYVRAQLQNAGSSPSVTLVIE